MRDTMKKQIVVAGLAVLALPLAGAGIALASPAADLGQGGSAAVATLENAVASFMDAADGQEPPVTDGVGTEVPPADPRFVEGPVGGLLNGPFD